MIRYAFIIQGEGRGHLTQAIACKQMMDEKGHQCVGILTGKSSQRVLPPFFYKKINHEIFHFRSPNFLKNKIKESYLVFLSIFYNLLLSPVFIRSTFQIHKKIKELKPDVIINFYEPLTGLWKMFFRSQTKVISISHQYFYNYPDFKMPGRFMERFFIRLLNKTTSYGSMRLFAIHIEKKESFKNITIIPPLIRKEIHQVETKDDGHFAVYLLNHGYAKDITRWHHNNPAIRIACFWDHPDKQSVLKYDETLSFFQLDDQKFIHSMATSHGLLSTAGYEAICEAAYLGKAVLMVPVKNHFEQYLNAKLFSEYGFGVISDEINPEYLIKFAPNMDKLTKFKEWVNQGNEFIIGEIENVLQMKYER